MVKVDQATCGERSDHLTSRWRGTGGYIAGFEALDIKRVRSCLKVGGINPPAPQLSVGLTERWKKYRKRLLAT